MTKLIEKSRTATTEMLMEVAMMTVASTAKEGLMVHTAAMVVLEERLGAEAFDVFADELEAA